MSFLHHIIIIIYAQWVFQQDIMKTKNSNIIITTWSKQPQIFNNSERQLHAFLNNFKYIVIKVITVM